MIFRLGWEMDCFSWLNCNAITRESCMSLESNELEPFRLFLNSTTPILLDVAGSQIGHAR
ncbi:hypothetical protein ACHAXS_012859 [Conticribra weissflogii]